MKHTREGAMKRIFFFLYAAIFFTLAGALPGLTAEGLSASRDFSARMESEANGMKTKGRMFFASDRQRVEMDEGGQGGGAVMIVRMDKKVIWMLMVDDKQYMEMPVTAQRQAVAPDPDKVIKRKKLGSETVDGHPCTKEQVTVKGADGMDEEFYWWFATDIKWPIKTAAVDGSWSQTYREIKFGRQDPALFELPKGYTKVDMPGFGTPDGGEDEGGDGQEPPEYQEPPEPPDEPDAPQPYIPDVPRPPLF